jgi:hypothetical protein
VTVVPASEVPDPKTLAKAEDKERRLVSVKSDIKRLMYQKNTSGFSLDDWRKIFGDCVDEFVVERIMGLLGRSRHASRVMNHDWQATGRFPYSKDNFGNESRQVFVCGNCGYETHRHSAPAPDEKMHVKKEPNETAYLSCEEMIVYKVMEA